MQEPPTNIELQTQRNQDVAERHHDVNVLRRVLYTFFFMFVCMIAVGTFNVWYTNHVNEERKAADQEHAEQGRAVTCALINAQVKVWSEATTPTGHKSAEAWHRMGDLLQCKEDK